MFLLNIFPLKLAYFNLKYYGLFLYSKVVVALAQQIKCSYSCHVIMQLLRNSHSNNNKNCPYNGHQVAWSWSIYLSIIHDIYPLSVVRSYNHL